MIGSEQKKIAADPWVLAAKVADQLRHTKGKDIGALEVGVIDIYDSVVKLYSALLPRLASLKNPSDDDLLGELAELRIELEHVRYHAALALEGIDNIAEELRSAAAKLERNGRSL